ncbi:MAG: glycoside hydrolase family 2, partial [Lachnospiraceae bacterium]|nr:glycoside hydrolase family 2 [Lachnospiraceae bacterium]
MERLKYPRPQFIRKKWLDLNGTWQFAFDDDNLGIHNKKYLKNEFYDMNIEVPFSYYTKNSGLNIKDHHHIIWYKKDLELEINKEKRYILYFGAVDYQCDIYVDDQHIYTHIGGHTPFEVDLTDYIKDKFSLVIRCVDYNLTTQPIGKQSWKEDNFLCW